MILGARFYHHAWRRSISIAICCGFGALFCSYLCSCGLGELLFSSTWSAGCIATDDIDLFPQRYYRLIWVFLRPDSWDRFPAWSRSAAHAPYTLFWSVSSWRCPFLIPYLSSHARLNWLLGPSSPSSDWNWSSPSLGRSFPPKLQGVSPIPSLREG